MRPSPLAWAYSMKGVAAVIAAERDDMEKQRRTKKELAEAAIKAWLADEGYTVLGTTLAIEGIKPVKDEKYGHELTVKFDGAKG